MTVKPAAQPSPYEVGLNDFNTRQKIYLMQSAMSGWQPVGSQPQYAFGSDAAMFYGLGQTLAVLKHAALSGYYGRGTHVDSLA